MKKWKLFLLIMLLSFSFVGCQSGQTSGNDYLIKIDYETLKEKMDHQETFFFELVQDGCTHCASFTPKLRDVLEEYQVTGYQLNSSDLSEEEYEEFCSIFGENGTPTIFFLEKGKEVSIMRRISGDISKDQLVAKLKLNGYIQK